MKKSSKNYLTAAGFLTAGVSMLLFPREEALPNFLIAGEAICGAGALVFGVFGSAYKSAENTAELLKPRPEDQRYLPKDQVVYPTKDKTVSPV